MDSGVKLSELKQASGPEQLGRESIIEQQERERDADLPRIYAVLPKWLQWLYLMDWLFRPWQYFTTKAYAVSYLAAYGFQIGSWFFMIGGAALLDPRIVNTQDDFTDSYDWLVLFTYEAGTVVWCAATTLQITEALNQGHDQRVAIWERNNCKGPKPKFRWMGVQLNFGDWWGAVLYTVGCVMYIIANAFGIALDFTSVHISETGQAWGVYWMFMGGGILFLIAGFSYTAALIDHNVLKGILVPFSRRHATSNLWWANWLYFWGGVAYFQGGIFMYWQVPAHPTLTVTQFRWETGFGYFLGSVLFFLGSLLYLMKMSAGRCLPGKLAVGRFDDTEHGGAPFKEMPTTDGWQAPSMQGPVSKLSSVYGRRSMTYSMNSLPHVSSSLAATKEADVV
ncbi:hypothetical protein WJX74_004188 [Apatococcus lobatus]|uniref:Uncharacterized protein n=2 Tax=Apatococcus TaxID=904362 RepID=A0AAW1T7S7_9CHLO